MGGKPLLRGKIRPGSVLPLPQSPPSRPELTCCPSLPSPCRATCQVGAQQLFVACKDSASVSYMAQKWVLPRTVSVEPAPRWLGQQVLRPQWGLLFP